MKERNYLTAILFCLGLISTVQAGNSTSSRRPHELMLDSTQETGQLISSEDRTLGATLESLDDIFIQNRLMETYCELHNPDLYFHGRFRSAEVGFPYDPLPQPGSRHTHNEIEYRFNSIRSIWAPSDTDIPGFQEYFALLDNVNANHQAGSSSNNWEELQESE